MYPFRFLSLLAFSSTLTFATVTYSYQQGPDSYQFGPEVNNFHSLLLAQDATPTPFDGSLDFWWASQFNTVAGGEKIASITVGFGPLAQGLPISLLLYSDQNGNGLADSLLLLGELDGTLPAFNPVPFAINDYYTLTFPTPIQVGSSFFIAALYKNVGPTVTCYVTTPPQPGPCVPDVTVDLNSPQGHSWYSYNLAKPNTLDPSNPTQAEGISAPADNPFNFVLNAEGVPGEASATPEPATAALVAIGAGALWVYRKRVLGR